MNIPGLLAFLLLIGAILWLVLQLRPKRKKTGDTGDTIPGGETIQALLERHVLFYQELNAEGKASFVKRVQHFLAHVRVTGVNTSVEDLDQVLVGASAIIPIYAFPDWEYSNLREVLVYPETFNEEFEQEGQDRSVLGMVGDGPMQRVMILSKHALEQGFLNKTDKHNTAIHEFVHLIDKTDGATDGIPENLMPHRYVLPWMKMIHENIQEIAKEKSDINPYGATNQAEFLAVVSEYFFERPDLLKRKHPDLYAMLGKIFRTREVNGE